MCLSFGVNGALDYQGFCDSNIIVLQIHCDAFCRGLRDSATSGEEDSLQKKLSRRLLELQVKA